MTITYERIYFNTYTPMVEVPAALRKRAEDALLCLVLTRPLQLTCADLQEGLSKGPCEYSTGWRITYTPDPE